MGNVAKWKTIGKFIIKSDFLILLIRAREGVFLLISCCGGRGGGSGVTFPPPHSHTNTNTPSYHIELLTHFQRPIQNVILLLYYTMFTWIKISRAWQIDMTQTLKHMLIFIDSESIDTKKAFQMLPNKLQIDHWSLVFLRVSLWGVDLV